MVERVLLPVRVPGKVPAKHQRRYVEATATAGLYVTPHPGDEEGWVLVTESGRWLANYVRWKTSEDAHLAAEALAREGVDWTLPSDGELFKAYPDFNDCYWAVVERFDDRRHPTGRAAQKVDGTSWRGAG